MQKDKGSLNHCAQLLMRLWPHLQGHIPCLYSQTENVKRRCREAAQQQTTSPTYGGRKNWKESTLTTAWMSLFYYEHEDQMCPEGCLLKKDKCDIYTMWQLLSVRTTNVLNIHKQSAGANPSRFYRMKQSGSSNNTTIFLLLVCAHLYFYLLFYYHSIWGLWRMIFFFCCHLRLC